jgi:hypothetical protein
LTVGARAPTVGIGCEEGEHGSVLAFFDVDLSAETRRGGPRYMKSPSKEGEKSS